MNYGKIIPVSKVVEKILKLNAWYVSWVLLALWQVKENLT